MNRKQIAQASLLALFILMGCNQPSALKPDNEPDAKQDTQSAAQPDAQPEAKQDTQSAAQRDAQPAVKQDIAVLQPTRTCPNDVTSDLCSRIHAQGIEMTARNQGILEGCSSEEASSILQKCIDMVRR
jgi:hypothetical protein